MRRETKRRGNIMATILTFQPRLKKTDIRAKENRIPGNARVIIFSGIRYERLPEASIVIAKPTKKARKTA
jgi:hypothetical protein